MGKSRELGFWGEKLATEFIKSKGYVILERNYRFKRNEIDIIAKKEMLLLFIEVKTRSNIDFGEPETFVDEKKAQRVIEAAENYMFETGWKGNIRFDIISVKTGTPPRILHLEDAFY